MTWSKKRLTAAKWVVRSLSVAIMAFGLPFYFGYGNPMPFTHPEYTVWDNMWLIVFPLMFLGLAVGLKLMITGGYLVTVSVGLGLLLGVLLRGGFVFHMMVPLAAGVLMLLVGYKRRKAARQA